jgi:hypothetical protein
MNPRLLPHQRPSLSLNLVDPRRLWHSAVNCVWASSCFCSSYGCLAKWEAGEQDTTLPIMVPGEAVLGAAVPGEEEHIEAFHPEASPRVEAEAFRVHECEGEAAVAAQDARINR